MRRGEIGVHLCDDAVLFPVADSSIITFFPVLAHVHCVVEYQVWQLRFLDPVFGKLRACVQ